MKRIRFYFPQQLLVLAFSVTFLYGCKKNAAAQTPTVTPSTTVEKGNYINPVFNHDFPDPNLVKGTDGYFYAYSTEADWTGDGIPGGRRFMPILKSKDLMAWEQAGSVLNGRPSWKSDGGLWAPDATEHMGKYFVYYSYSTWGDPNPGIGVATADQPQGPFTDNGKVFLSKEVGVDNSIDQYVMEDSGKLYMVWGSFHGIYGIELTDDGLQTVGEKFKLGGDAYEGSYIYKKGDFYYYFGSTGSCCEGIKSTYKVRVARATSFKGPYIDKDGKPLLENGGNLLLQANGGTLGFVGTGHNGDIFTDDNGDTWMLYHAFDKVLSNKRVLLLDKITWGADGWPTVAGSEPTYTQQKGPVFK
jgi:arabinan endo-1,5-alpha-L-arabinosidase